MCGIVGTFYCFFRSSFWYTTKMVSRKKNLPVFYSSYLLIYTFCEVVFVLGLLNSHVLTIASATRALPLAFPGPLPFPEGIAHFLLPLLLKKEVPMASVCVAETCMLKLTIFWFSGELDLE